MRPLDLEKTTRTAKMYPDVTAIAFGRPTAPVDGYQHVPVVLYGNAPLTVWTPRLPVVRVMPTHVVCALRSSTDASASTDVETFQQWMRRVDARVMLAAYSDQRSAWRIAATASDCESAFGRSVTGGWLPCIRIRQKGAPAPAHAATVRTRLVCEGVWLRPSDGRYGISWQG